METFLTPNEVAKLERVHIRSVYRWLTTGRLKADRRGKSWKIRPEDLRQMTREYEPDPGRIPAMVREEKKAARAARAQHEAAMERLRARGMI